MFKPVGVIVVVFVADADDAVAVADADKPTTSDMITINTITNIAFIIILLI